MSEENKNTVEATNNELIPVRSAVAPEIDVDETNKLRKRVNGLVDKMEDSIAMCNHSVGIKKTKMIYRELFTLQEARARDLEDFALVDTIKSWIRYCRSYSGKF